MIYNYIIALINIFLLMFRFSYAGEVGLLEAEERNLKFMLRPYEGTVTESNSSFTRQLYRKMQPFYETFYSTGRETPNYLGSAAANGSKEGIEGLLDAGEDPRRKDNSGRTPAEIADCYGYEECARILREAEATLNNAEAAQKSLSGKVKGLLKRVKSAVFDKRRAEDEAGDDTESVLTPRKNITIERIDNPQTRGDEDCGGDNCNIIEFLKGGNHSFCASVCSALNPREARKKPTNGTEREETGIMSTIDSITGGEALNRALNIRDKH